MFSLGRGFLDRVFGDAEVRFLHLGLDAAEPQTLVRCILIPGDHDLFGDRTGAGEVPHQAVGRMMGNVPGVMVVLLVDVTIKDDNVVIGHQQVDGLGAVSGGPVPFRHEIEEGTMGEDDDAVVFFLVF